MQTWINSSTILLLDTLQRYLLSRVNLFPLWKQISTWILSLNYVSLRSHKIIVTVYIPYISYFTIRSTCNSITLSIAGKSLCAYFGIWRPLFLASLRETLAKTTPPFLAYWLALIFLSLSYPLNRQGKLE